MCIQGGLLAHWKHAGRGILSEVDSSKFESQQKTLGEEPDAPGIGSYMVSVRPHARYKAQHCFGTVRAEVAPLCFGVLTIAIGALILVLAFDRCASLLNMLHV